MYEYNYDRLWKINVDRQILVSSNVSLDMKQVNDNLVATFLFAFSYKFFVTPSVALVPRKSYERHVTPFLVIFIVPVCGLPIPQRGLRTSQTRAIVYE